jgi:peroxiredoxin
VQLVKSEFDQRKVAIVIVSFAEPERLELYQKHHQWPFIMLADPKRTAYKAFALGRLSWLQVFSPGTLRLYVKLLRGGKRLENYGKDDYYQTGGDFLIDPKGNILFAYRSEEPSDRPAVAQLLQEIDRARRSAEARDEPMDR